MLLLKYLLVSGGITMFVIAAGILTYDLYLLLAYRRLRLAPLGDAAVVPLPPPAMRWRTTIALGMLAWAPLLILAAIVFVPSGTAGTRGSLTQGTLSGISLRP
jgi:hypothetical protein